MGIIRVTCRLGAVVVVVELEVLVEGEVIDRCVASQKPCVCVV